MAPPNELSDVMGSAVVCALLQDGATGTEIRKMKKKKKVNGVNKKKVNRAAAAAAPPPRKSLIRKRPVSFGNPALGTYHGCLYTLDVIGEDYSPAINVRPIVEGAESVERIVAMVDVPPEQVPEGILNLASSHRPYIDHVRIVIAENNEDFQMESYKLRKEEEEEKRALLVESEKNEEVFTQHQRGQQVRLGHEKRTDELVSAVRSSFEQQQCERGGSDYGDLPLQATSLSAASIMAADEEQEKQVSSSLNNDTDSSLAAKEVTRNTNSLKGLDVENNGNTTNNKEDDNFTAPSRTYLVLLELCSVEAAELFVEDLHGRPYTSLDPTEKCSVHQVLAVSGEDGVSLLSPFFAPTAKSTSPNASANALKSTSDSTTTAVTIPSGGSSTSSISSGSAPPQPKNGGAPTPPVSSAVTPTSATSSSSSSSHKGTTAPAPIAEDYNCAVCLEHMILSEAEHQQDDNNISKNNDPPKMRSILTTVCNHSFHMDCLLKWQDSPCPVCRYDHSGLNEALSQCHVCGRTENNYVCLICGVVSCGGPPPSMINGRVMTSTARVDQMYSQSPVCGGGGGGGGSAALPHNDNSGNVAGSGDRGTITNANEILSAPRNLSQSHARRHYDETLHAYALDTETQHVWDFAGQGYVHRLLQNKEDGKLVEFHDPSNTSSHERSLTPGLSDTQEGEVVHRKLEGFASQYYTLLKSQLEQQRTYYQGRLGELRREIKKKAQTSDLIHALKQEKAQLSKRVVSLKARHCKVVEDTAFLKSMNESLEANKEPLKRKVKDAQRKRIESRDQLQQCLPVLEDKVSLLLQELTGETHDNKRDSDAPSAENPKALQHCNSSSDENKKPAAKP